MYSRSDSVTLTVTQRESFGFTRSTEPEVFTFERIPAPQATAVRSYVPIRPRKRCTRVMYPAKVRMHLPPPERSQAKRWLVILVLVVLWQIYTEEPCVDTPLGATDSPATDYQDFSYQTAEEQQQQLGVGSELQAGDRVSGEPLIHNKSPEPGHEAEVSSFEQSTAGKSYVVALLVYHRLGTDK